jgi:hypothetical protein
MKRRASVLCGLFILMLAVPLWAYAQVGTHDSFLRQFTGVKLPAANGVVMFGENQPVIGEVVNEAVLMGRGLKGVKNGDAVEATWLGGEKFKLMHIPSGKSIEIVFPKDKLNYQLKDVKGFPLVKEVDAPERPHPTLDENGNP